MTVCGVLGFYGLLPDAYLYFLGFPLAIRWFFSSARLIEGNVPGDSQVAITDFKVHEIIPKMVGEFCIQPPRWRCISDSWDF
jgi:hypothetical protein